MHIPTAYIALAAFVLHFTLGMSGHSACAPADCQHVEEVHQHAGDCHEDDQPAPGQSLPDGKTCNDTKCSVVLTAKTSLAKLSPCESLPLADLSVWQQRPLPSFANGRRAALDPGEFSLGLLLRTRVLLI